MRVGFVGLGNMGGRITRRIVAGGYPVLGFDVDPARAAEAGASAASSPAAVAEGADTVLLSLPDSPVVEAVILGDDGILGGARPVISYTNGEDDLIADLRLADARLFGDRWVG